MQKKLGIKNGDVVRVFNKRGEVLAGAVVSDEIMQGVVRLCEGVGMILMKTDFANVEMQMF